MRFAARVTTRPMSSSWSIDLRAVERRRGAGCTAPDSLYDRSDFPFMIDSFNTDQIDDVLRAAGSTSSAATRSARSPWSTQSASACASSSNRATVAIAGSSRPACHALSAQR